MLVFKPERHTNDFSERSVCCLQNKRELKWCKNECEIELDSENESEKEKPFRRDVRYMLFLLFWILAIDHACKECVMRLIRKWLSSCYTTSGV